MEDTSKNADDIRKRNSSSGRPTSRLSSLEYLGTVAAASEIIDLGTYANVVECSRLQVPEAYCHSYLPANGNIGKNFCNSEPRSSVSCKQSPILIEDCSQRNHLSLYESSCSSSYSNMVPFHRLTWNNNHNDVSNCLQIVPGCSSSGKFNQESTSRQYLPVNNGAQEKLQVDSSVQTNDQSQQNVISSSEPWKDSADSLRWPQQVKESLKNCDDSSIKLLADACIISHERQSLKSSEEPFAGLIDMQEIANLDPEPTPLEDKPKSYEEDFSNYYDNCCEFNSVICDRTTNDQGTENNRKETNIRDIYVMSCDPSRVISRNNSKINEPCTWKNVWRKREIVKRLQRSKPTTKQVVKHLLRKVYSAESKSKKRKLESMDTCSSSNLAGLKTIKNKAIRSLPIILNFSKAWSQPENVLLNHKLRFMNDRGMRSRMNNITELTEHAENFTKFAKKGIYSKNNAKGEDIGNKVCLGTVQAHACHELNDVTRCLECVYPHRVSSDYCRFMDFRNIHKNLQTNKLESRGFIDYCSYAKNSLFNKNKALFNEFLPRRRSIKNGGKWSPRLACYVIRCLIDQFKRLLSREEKILEDCFNWRLTSTSLRMYKINIPWRDAFNARELCDICSTTIFNLHLMCKHCALDICIDCFYARLREEKRIELPGSNQDSFGWSLCTVDRKNQAHKPRDLILSNLIPDPDDDTLWTLRALNRILDEKICLYKIDADKTNYLLPVPTNQSISNETIIKNSRLPPFSHFFGKDILVLESPKNPSNICLFQHHWYKGKPVIINRVLQDLEPMMWRPTILEEKCAGRSTEGTIVDCRTGAVIENFDVSLFWTGFLDCHKRIEGLDGRKLLLKLKDWPSGDKFSELLLEHFQKFCKALPLPQYTHPNSGEYNLATNLPSFCITPDLGPKLYIAYEMIFEPSKGTTNLHLDVSDAVNVLVNVTTPANINPSYLYCAILKHLGEQNLDPADLERAKKCPSRIGALWTIFKPEDSETIRMYLHELAAEDRKSDCDDPIHDQMLYLDVPLRKRLETERGVKGYTFVQMLGDAVFIPAGAAHQVQNLLCCVKVAEDFVSPEGISYCATMAGEFRNLTRAHTNHEDKLQLPNIILHSLRKAASVLNDGDV